MPVPSRRRALSGLSVLAALLTLGLVGSARPSDAAVAPAADYQLQHTLASTVSGAPSLTDIGTGNAYVSSTVDSTANRTVRRWPVGGGLQRSSALGSMTASTYTVVLLYKPLVTDGPYHRILNLDGLSGDTGLYERGGALSAYPDAGSSTTPLTSTAFHQVVLTRTSGKVVTGYVDGSKVLQFTDSSDRWLATDQLVVGKDNTTNGATGEETGGQLARLRLYRTALTASDVASLDRLPGGQADVAVTYADGPDPVAHGSLLAYTATISDNGPASATPVTATLTVPGGTTFVGSSASQGSCSAPASGKVTCALGTIGIGQHAQVLLVVDAPSATGSISSTVTASSPLQDGTAGNNAATQTTTVR